MDDVGEMTWSLKQVEDLLPQLPSAVERRKLGERLREAVQALRAAPQQIQRIRTLMELADVLECSSDLLDEVRDAALEIGEELENVSDPEVLHTATDEYRRTLIPAVGRLEHALRERCRVFTAERFQPQVGIGKLLTQMHVPDNLGERLVACAQQGMQLATQGTVAEMLSGLRTRLAELDALQRERSTRIPDGEVGGFIAALVEERATLAMVTPDVVQWLAEHGALEDFVVRPR
ncbi:hypothetical protein CFR73_01695 [Novacetimonas maltaceti]|uniref:Uncharacterized protein n=1 Tax=Novacetimonas maltaceti TaxID=1203393 RepID=A0A2S3W303_9PROT|nr:hypothetical protein [Novacetimonas maltaceti]POF62923.1 hypothetical protein KMAL_14230 [Novacetimonas maltaceti]PYD61773.1 hypothetical protein CFR73_01695 [Novacetimonas maltaceti]